MKKMLAGILLTFSLNIFSYDIINLSPRRIYGGKYIENGKRTDKMCFFQFNYIAPDHAKGLHCYNLYSQLIFDIQGDVINKNQTLKLSSKISNLATEMNKAPTCASIVHYPPSDIDPDRWGNDESYLYLKEMNGSETYNNGDNTYKLLLNDESKAPERVIFIRSVKNKKSIFECADLEEM